MVTIHVGIELNNCARHSQRKKHNARAENVRHQQQSIFRIRVFSGVLYADAHHGGNLRVDCPTAEEKGSICG